MHDLDVSEGGVSSASKSGLLDLDRDSSNINFNIDHPSEATPRASYTRASAAAYPDP